MVSHFQRLALATLVLALASPCLSQFESCTNPVTNCDSNTDYFPDKITLEHSQTATVKYAKTYVDITVTDSFDVTHKHRLVRCGCTAPTPSAGIQVINVPPARIFVNDGPTLAFLTHSIPQIDRIVAVGNPDYVYSSSIRNRFQDGTDNAALAARDDVHVAFINLFSVAGHKSEVPNIPFFANGESAEATPFGRSEWIKIIGLMFDSVETANTEYDSIVSRYNRMKALAEGAARRPSVLLNYPSTWESSTTWALPSQKQYITHMLRDANVDYLFMNDGKDETNILTTEEVSTKFKWARYLLVSGPYPPVDSTKMEDFFLPAGMDGAEDTNTALRSLASVNCANVWVKNKRIAGEGYESANDYFEWGAIRPDLLLQDIVYAVHPNVDVDDSTTFSFKVDTAADSVKGGACPYNDLLGTAPSGKRYVDFTMEVTGQNRFEVENKLVEKIIPKIASDERLDSKSVDAFFEKPQKAGSTTLKLRLMVDDNDTKSVSGDGSQIAQDVQSALGGGAIVSLQDVQLANGVVINTRKGLGGGGIGGIIGGLLGVAIAVALVLFAIGRRKGKKVGAQEIKDRFWKEHGVRLADDVEKE